MFAITRSLVRTAGLRSSMQMLRTAQPAAQIQMKVVPAKTTTTREGFEEKNIRMGRVMSPHLTIYKPQLTSMLSITHRATGTALGVLAWSLGIFALATSNDMTYYIDLINNLELNPNLVLAAKAILAFPIGYHLANGIRHLLWDSGLFLKIGQVYLTGYVMLVLAFILTGALTML